MRGRRVTRLLCAAIAGLAMSPEASPRPAPVGEVVLIAAGSEIDFVASTVAPPATRVGLVALSDLARIDRAAAARPEVLLAGDPAPASFTEVGVGDDERAGRGPMPLGTRGDEPCRCKTEIADARDERVAAIHASAHFTVEDAGRLGVLELRVRGHDGLVAHVNGHEVARRNLPVAAVAADQIRGPEWESFLVPVTEGLLRPGRNLLAVELRPSEHRDDLGLDLELRGRSGGAVVRGPMVQRVATTSAVIVFDTDLPVRAAVEILGEEGERRVVSAGGALARHHQVAIDGLEAGQAVRYRVIAGGEVGAEASFHAAPARGEPVRFAVYGDTRGGHEVHARIAEALIAEAPDFVLVTGDLVMRGSDEADWQRFFDVAADLLAHVPYYTVAGNHDLGSSGDEGRRLGDVFALWPGPPGRPAWGNWYSFDVAGVHVVMLDSNAYDYAEQLAWLERDLAAARAGGARAIFAVTHDGPYSRGIHRGDRVAAELYAPVLVAGGVTMLFSGHDHLYQRGEKDGLRYIVSGGGGAPLYPVRCGGRGQERCTPDGMKHVERAYHYLTVAVYDGHIEVCPRRPDATALEPCLRIED